MEIIEIIKDFKGERQSDYTEIGVRKRLIRKYWLERLESLWYKYWPYLLFLLAVSEILVVIIGFTFLLEYGYSRYEKEVGVEKILWQLMPTFAFLNGIFLASYTAYRARKEMGRRLKPNDTN